MCGRAAARLDNDVGTGVHLTPTGIEFDERRLTLGNSTEVSSATVAAASSDEACTVASAPARVQPCRYSTLIACTSCWLHSLYVCCCCAAQLRAGATLRFPRSLPVDRDDPDAFKLAVHRLSLKTLW